MGQNLGLNTHEFKAFIGSLYLAFQSFARTCKVSFHEIGKFFYTWIRLSQKEARIIRKIEDQELAHSLRTHSSVPQLNSSYESISMKAFL
jgi:hypothetical protein